MRLLLSLIIVSIVKNSVQLQCPIGSAKNIDGNLTCPEPILYIYPLTSVTEEKIIDNPYAILRELDVSEPHPYSDTNRHIKWKELQHCGMNSDCKLSNQDFLSPICLGACFVVRDSPDSLYVNPNSVGLRHCETNMDCADPEYMDGSSYDPWYCNKDVKGYRVTTEPPVAGVCMKGPKICPRSDARFASRPTQGDSCDLNDHSTCAGAGIAAVDTSREYIPTCVQHPNSNKINLCCQDYALKCVDETARMKGGDSFECDQLVTAAIRVRPGTHSIYKSEQRLLFGELFPIYKDGSNFQKDSGKDLATCTTNADCKYLTQFSHNGYCYSARNIETNHIVERKMFCFKMRVNLFSGVYNTIGNVYVDPKEVGLKYCTSHADCFNKTHLQGVRYNAWFCHKMPYLTDTDGNEHYGICMRSSECSRYASLTVDGKECDTDESCRGSGAAAVDTVNDFIPTCNSHLKGYKLCCQDKMLWCPTGFNARPRTNCSSDNDCATLGNSDNMKCDSESKICCDLTVSAYLQRTSFSRLLKLLSNETMMNMFYSDEGSVWSAEFKKEFSLGFDESAKEAIVDAHNGLRQSIGNGSFSVNGEKLPAAQNMKPLKWNQSFAVHAKVAAIKSCSRNIPNVNIEKFDMIFSDVENHYETSHQFAVQAVNNWESRLRSNFTFTREDLKMIVIPETNEKAIYRMISDTLSEVGCAYTLCESSAGYAPIFACFYGLAVDHKILLDGVYEIAQ